MLRTRRTPHLRLAEALLPVASSQIVQEVAEALAAVAQLVTQALEDVIGQCVEGKVGLGAPVPCAATIRVVGSVNQDEWAGVGRREGVARP